MAESKGRGTRDIIGGPAPVVGGTRFYTDSWAVIVGINQYKSENVRSLSCAVNDADAVERTIDALGFPPERIIEAARRGGRT